MDLSELEDVLGKDLHILCYPLSIIIRKYDNISCMGKNNRLLIMPVSMS